MKKQPSKRIKKSLKSKQKKTTTTKERVVSIYNRQSRGAKWYIWFGLIISTFIIWFGVYQVQAHIERNGFIRAKTELSAVADEVAAKMGKPEKRVSSDACGYTSEKYSRGNRYCDVNIYMYYRIPNNSAVEFGDAIEKAISSSQSIENYSLTRPTRSKVTITYSSFSLKSFKQCGAQEDIVNSNESVNKKDKFVKLSLNCGGNAKAEYFPVES